MRNAYRANFIIEVEMMGFIGDEVVDVANPDSSPAFILEFIKNRCGPKGRHIFRGNSIVGEWVLGQEEELAAKAAINKFMEHGDTTVYLNERYNR